MPLMKSIISMFTRSGIHPSRSFKSSAHTSQKQTFSPELLALPKKSKSITASDDTSKTHRYQLSAVIRETLHTNGMSSTSCKFKLITVGSSGYEFIALIETVEELGERIMKLQSLGGTIISDSRIRFGIVVKSVFWNMSGDAVPVKAAGIKNLPLPKPEPEPFLTAPAQCSETARAELEAEFDREMRKFSTQTGLHGRYDDTRPMKFSDSQNPSDEEIESFKEFITSPQYGKTS